MILVDNGFFQTNRDVRWKIHGIFFAYSGNGLASTPSTQYQMCLYGEAKSVFYQVLNMNSDATSGAFFYCDLLCVLLFLLLNTNIIICYVNLGRDA